MIKEIIETIPNRRTETGKLIPKHDVVLSYDTLNIKDICSDCGRKMMVDEKRYISKGNYCNPCNAKYNYDNHAE